jgi:hypothetical protein
VLSPGLSFSAISAGCSDLGSRAGPDFPSVPLPPDFAATMGQDFFVSRDFSVRVCGFGCPRSGRGLASGFGLVAAQVRDLLGAGSVFHSLFPVRTSAFVSLPRLQLRSGFDASSVSRSFGICNCSSAGRVTCSRTRQALSLLACQSSL